MAYRTMPGNHAQYPTADVDGLDGIDWMTRNWEYF